ncbi:T9SS type A sorting domain-containing protein [Aureibaculum algae]|uniref:T9SS type A sorting domain-containing protein n=1 Tax=Aureibaculum algae TaxID=2584122 RepID=A0A5B7TZ58_9FLAO|nr:T9SS type A sorting domain-containing protein [Aureibaculum algae]QCX40674.1 T9SS type A sorting domain-containing protein [Aureibaculum algae]
MKKLWYLLLFVTGSIFSQQHQLYYEYRLVLEPFGDHYELISDATDNSGYFEVFSLNDIDDLAGNIPLTIGSVFKNNDTFPYQITTLFNNLSSGTVEEAETIAINGIGSVRNVTIILDQFSAIQTAYIKYYTANIMSLNQPSQTSVCGTINVSATTNHPSEAYKWQFQALTDIWQDVPIQQGQDNLSISLEDLYGANANAYLNTPVRFKINNQYGAYDSNIVDYTFTDCSPGLAQNPPQPIQSTCSNSNDGSVDVQFDRSLASNERMLIYIEKQLPDNSWDLYLDTYILEPSAISTVTNNTYNWNSILEPGNYRVRYITKYDSTGDIPTNPNSDELSNEFQIIAPTPVTFTHAKADILCFGNTDGSITINASGGSNTGFEYSIDNGTSWQSNNKFNNLTDATYSLLAKDGNGCVAETNQQAIITTPQNLFNIVADIVNEPSANGVSDGNISIDVFGGTGVLDFQWTKNGANYASTQNITGLGAGVYQITSTDANGCASNTLEFTLEEPPVLSVQFTLVQEIDCNGGTGTIEAQGYGGSSANDDSYTYLWSNGSTNQTQLNILANSYTVSVTDSNLASVTATYDLVEPPALLVTSTSTDVLCNGGSDGTVSLAITGGTGAYVINWNDDNTISTPTRTGLAQGEYFYTVSDANSLSCNITGSITIAQPLPIDIQSIAQQPTAAGATDGTITITVSEGTTPYTYQWTDTNGTMLATTKDINGLGAGDYSVTVRDTNYNLSADNLGCESSLLVTLVEPQTIDVNIIETQTVSCQGNDGILTAEVIGGTAPFEYQWLKEENGNYQDLFQDIVTINNLSAGSYRLVVTDVNSVTNQADITLNNPGTIVVAPTTTNVACNGANNGSLQLNISGGLAPYVISWDDSAVTTENRSNLSKGEYFYTIEDANNCTINGSITISEPNPITIVIDAQQNPSSGNATDGLINITVSNGTSPYMYEWKNSNGDVLVTTEDISGLGIDTYTLTVRDANYNTVADVGCETSVEITLVNPNVLSVIISETQSVDCFGGSNGTLEAQVTGGIEPYVYQWYRQENGTYVNLNQNVVSINNLSAGNYRVLITDANIDEAQFDFTLSQPEEILVNPVIINVTCNGNNDGTVTLTPTGGTGNYTISWLDDSTITSFNRSDLVADEYYYTISDEKGCILDSSVTITEPSFVVITTENKQNPSISTATDGSIDISVTGGTTPYSFEWKNSNGDVIATTEDINGLGVDSYTVIVRDANYNTVSDIGCESTSTILLSDPTVLSVTITETQLISCFGGDNGMLSAEVIGGSSPFDYQWLKEDSGNYLDLNVSTTTIENRSAGKYRVIVTDNNSATTQFDFTLSEPVEIAIDSSIQSASCFGNNDGSIDITVSGGTEPYSFSWKNENGFEVSTSEDLVNVVAGNYTITITDTNGCTSENTIEIAEPAELLEIKLDELKDPSAFGINDGFVNVNIAGGDGPYLFEWTDINNNTISTEEDLSNVGEGVYTLMVVDNNGCSVSEQFALLAPDELNITINESIAILCFGDQGELQAFVTGGVLNTGSDYSYQWFKEENGSYINLNNSTNIISDIRAGTYRIIVNDDSTIDKTLTYILTEPTEISNDLNISNSVSCTSGADGAISSTISGGSLPYSYLWNNGSEEVNLTDLSVGTYTLTVTDNNGCIAKTSIELTQPDGMSIESEVLKPSCSNENDGSISLTITNGTAPFTYLWNTGATDSSISNLIAGDYSVTITDASGCVAVQNFTLDNPDPLTIDLGENRILCLDQNLELDATIEDLGATYQWTSNNGFSSTSPLIVLKDEGTYSLTVINSSGCSAVDSIEITSTNEVISANFLVPTQAFENEIIVLVDVSEPVPDTVNWSFSEGTTIVSQNGDYAELMFEKAGVYTATMIAKRGSCDAVLTKEIIVQESTSFGSPQTPHANFIEEFTIFPNPNNGVFKAEVKLLQSAPVSLKIVNLATNAIVNTKIASGKEYYVFDYNSTLAIGVYMVMLETPKGTQVRKIIIK